MFVSKLFLIVFGFEFGCLGLENQAVARRAIAKNRFRRNWVWVALGPFCMIFVSVEIGLKFDYFSW